MLHALCCLLVFRGNFIVPPEPVDCDVMNA